MHSRLDRGRREAVKLGISPEGGPRKRATTSSSTLASYWLMKDLFGNFFFSYLLLAINVAAVVYLITQSWFHS
jgi:hypothetical protein